MKKTPSLIFALRKYGAYQRRKGSPEAVIYKYYRDIYGIFEKCGKIDDRRKIKSEEIEKLIRKQKRQKSTQATKSHQIRSFFKFCRIQEYKTIEHYKILPVKTVMKEAKFLREEDIEKILNYSKSNLKTFVILKLFLTTGMRISEVVSLTSEQILNATRIGKVYQLNIIGKGNKLRSIFPPKETLDLCKRIIGKTETILGWKKSRVANLMRRISKETKIKFSAHTLRHTYLSYLARKGADIYKIQKIAGHSSITTTALYLHSANKELAETASLIKGLI